MIMQTRQIILNGGYAAIASVDDASDLENKAREAFIKEKRQPDLIRIVDVEKLQVEERMVYFALAISYYGK